jgi:Malectin domain/Secretion system C-terminal sorting domain/Divergent InlB B-repeat domain
MNKCKILEKTNIAIKMSNYVLNKVICSDNLCKRLIFSILFSLLFVAVNLNAKIVKNDLQTVVAAPVTRFFDRTKDILIAQFDNKPDADDIHSQAAFASIMAHPDSAGINYFAVAGAYGIQSGKYINSNSLFTLAFGAQNINWTDAKNDRANSITRIVAKVKPVLLAGGLVWVQEAGQSDITADWIKQLLLENVPAQTIKNNVIVVQHSEWNENNTTATKLNYVKTNANYVPIDDGNVDFGDYTKRKQRGAQTPKYVSSDLSFMVNAMSTTNPNAIARAFWVEADKIIKASGFSASYSEIPKGGVDFSDCVENWFILNLGTTGNSVANFWSKYVVNSTVNNKKLTIVPTQNGTVIVNSDTNLFPINSTVTLTAKPAVGYMFSGWGGDHSGTSLVSLIQMNSDKTITANFVKTSTFAINCGGDQFISTDGRVYAQTPVGFTRANTITGTVDQFIFQSERSANAPFSYNLPVDNGNYTVILRFAEIYFTAVGKRVFNVAIEQTPVLSNFDIFAAAGGANKAIDRTFKTTVSDGILDINFSSVINNAKISAIVIIKEPNTAQKVRNTKVLNTLKDSNSGIFIYPNPATDQLSYNSTNSIIENIEMFDLSGKNIYSEMVNQQSGSINLSGITKGLYLVRVKTENGTITKKITVQ